MRNFIALKEVDVFAHLFTKESFMFISFPVGRRANRVRFHIRGVMAAIAILLSCQAATAQQGKPIPWPNESPVDHRALLKSLDAAAVERGKIIYAGLCINCHGEDGRSPSLEVARAFATQEMAYGNDPYAMFLTITHGNGQMPNQAWMSPQERYDVIHYIRETFMKPGNPVYEPVTDDYLEKLPKFVPSKNDDGLNNQSERDYGPVLASQLETRVVAAMTVKIGENTTLSYNTHRMDQAGLWQGGFLDLSQTHHFKLRGEGQPKPVGKAMERLQYWKWGHGGTLDYPTEGLLPRGPLPQKWYEFHGHYLNGSRIVFSYSIDGRRILEMPQKERGYKGVRHVLRIEPGDKPLVLAVGRGEGNGTFFDGVVLNEYATTPEAKRGAVDKYLAISAQEKNGEVGRFVGAIVRGDTRGLQWYVDEEHRIILRVPPGSDARNIELIRGTGESLADVENLIGLMELRKIRSAGVQDLQSLIKGGPSRWVEVLETTGELGTPGEADKNMPYALDTITVPYKNPWNVWIRTSAMDFFSDGRAAVSTHGGDVWIVSGIDKDIDKLRWKRFAAGMFEPFGLRIIDDVIYVTCRDRIIRLHDFNKDNEADYYETFYADYDVSTFFHAYNFDLQTDDQGNFYYIKAGMYTSHALPGSVVKLSPDGKEMEIFCTGFRTPNGMGRMPDGRFTASDNQGNWMPASKISILKKDGFYGYVQTHRAGDQWAPDGGRIDHRKVVPPETFDQPVIWMPQDLDSSSGGQVTADPRRFGPLSGRFMHTSFGKGWMYYLTIQDIGDSSNGAIIRLPHQFNTGIMRARVNPVDGQVYATGLTGWQGPNGGLDGGVQRLRYTGGDMVVLQSFAARKGQLRLTFNQPLDKETATKADRYNIEQWNYRWSAGYGSPHFP